MVENGFNFITKAAFQGKLIEARPITFLEIMEIMNASLADRNSKYNWCVSNFEKTRGN